MEYWKKKYKGTLLNLTIFFKNHRIGNNKRCLQKGPGYIEHRWNSTNEFIQLSLSRKKYLVVYNLRPVLSLFPNLPSRSLQFRICCSLFSQLAFLVKRHVPCSGVDNDCCIGTDYFIKYINHSFDRDIISS